MKRIFKGFKGNANAPPDAETDRQARRFAQQMVLAAAALTILVVPVYHIAEFFQAGRAEPLWWQHGLFRAQAMIAAAIALGWCTIRPEGRCAPVMTRVLALSLMVMMFGMFTTDYLSAAGDVDRMVRGLIMTTFVVAVLSLRGAREMLVIFSLPCLVSTSVLIRMDASAVALFEELFDVAMVLVIGAIVSELLYRTRLSAWTMQVQLRQHATTDALTGLDNRRHVMPQLHSEIARARRSGTTFSVIMGDLDHFKRVNDEHGHAAGDRVLKSVARIMRASIRTQDRAVRWGGEEFLILLPDTRADQARIAAEKIRRTVSGEAFDVNAHKIAITISMGVAEYHGESEPDNLIERADNALYQAKRAGRDRVCVAQPVALA